MKIAGSYRTDHAAETLLASQNLAMVVWTGRSSFKQASRCPSAELAWQALYEKVPIADEEDKPGIADEVALGVTYREIDDYLEGKEVSAKAQGNDWVWWRKGQHKRH